MPLLFVSSPRRSGTSAGQSSFQGVEELLKALRRRGPDILDILVECLEEEKEANSEIIGKIREGRCVERKGEGVRIGGSEGFAETYGVILYVWCLSPPVQSGQRPPHKRPSHLKVRGSSSLQTCFLYCLCVDSMNILLRA